MGKTPKPKNKGPPSLHSRAARRATSPSLAGNIDKSLAKVPRAESNHGRNILVAKTSAGITKKSKKSHVSRHQRLRREKGMQRADEFSEKLQVKAAKSGERSKTIKDRAKDWDDVNGSTSTTLGTASQFDVLQGKSGEQGEWMDLEDDDDAGDDAVSAPVQEMNLSAVIEPVTATSSRPENVPLPDAQEDEIL